MGCGKSTQALSSPTATDAGQQQPGTGDNSESKINTDNTLQSEQSQKPSKLSPSNLTGSQEAAFATTKVKSTESQQDFFKMLDDKIEQGD